METWGQWMTIRKAEYYKKQRQQEKQLVSTTIHCLWRYPDRGGRGAQRFSPGPTTTREPQRKASRLGQPFLHPPKRLWPTWHLLPVKSKIVTSLLVVSFVCSHATGHTFHYFFLQIHINDRKNWFENRQNQSRIPGYYKIRKSLLTLPIFKTSYLHR